MPMTRFRASLRAFLKDEGGVILAETLILLPLLVWGFLALVVYWDVFRTINTSQKAAYSIADLVSRQGIVTEDFVAGMQEVLAFLTPGAPASKMRITSFEFDEGATINAAWDADDRYIMWFSRVSGGGTTAQLTVADLEAAAFRARIPDLSDLESVVLVETWVDYVPDFDTGVLEFTPGITDKTFTQFIVTRPRNWRVVCIEDTPGCV